MIIDVLKSQNGYMFKLPSDYRSYNREYFKVDNQKVDAGKTYTTDNVPIIELWKSVTVEVKAKSKVDGKPDLTIDEYHKTRHEFESKRVWDKYEEHKIFEDLDLEYAYKRFLRDYEIIQRSDEELIQVAELNFQTKVESDNPFISLHRHLGKDIINQAATYDRWGFYKNYIRKYLAEKGFTLSESTSPGKGFFKIYEYNQGMVNLYMEGKQLFDITVHSFSDELPLVLKKYEEDKKWIEDKIDNYVRNTSTLPNVQDVISKLASIYSKVSSIQSKQKTYEQYNAALRMINTYINELEKGNKTV